VLTAQAAVGAYGGADCSGSSCDRGLAISGDSWVGVSGTGAGSGEAGDSSGSGRASTGGDFLILGHLLVPHTLRAVFW
jgi:hypothetical protein